MDPLKDVARVIRSKNAGPTKLTLDVLFDDEAGFRRGVAALDANEVARAFGRDIGAVTVTAYLPAFALKIVMDRPQVAGAPGDRDIYGAQQHGPLLDVMV
jgi:hypothetical protein